QPCCGASLSSSDESIALTHHSRRWLGCTDHLNSGKRLRDGVSAVGRAIVHHGNVKADSLLAHQRPQAPAEAILLIAGGNNHVHGYFWVGCWHWNQVFIKAGNTCDYCFDLIV